MDRPPAATGRRPSDQLGPVGADAPLDPVGAFEALQAAWERACTRAPRAVFEASYLLAGRSVRLRVVGPRLARLVSRPFAHVRISDPGPPALTIDLYEGASPARWHGLPLAGVLASSADGRFLAHARSDSRMVLDRRRGRLAGRIDPDGAQAGRERARPLSLMLAVWCGDREIQLVHAGLVARDGHGVLLGGSSGAGKSTAALACAIAGFDFLGDDCIALRQDGDGTFEGHSLYCSTALAPAQLPWFPALAQRATEAAPGDDDKAIVFGTEAFPGRLPPMARIRLLVLPRIVKHGPLGARPATKAEALLALGPSSLVKRAVPARGALRGLARLVERVPSYWLDVDPQLDAIPRRVGALLTEVVRG
jgi:hypothetical protein